MLAIRVMGRDLSVWDLLILIIRNERWLYIGENLAYVTLSRQAVPTI
jgi:hypothetical protein